MDAGSGGQFGVCRHHTRRKDALLHRIRLLVRRQVVSIGPLLQTPASSGVFFYLRIGSFKHAFQANPQNRSQRLSGRPDRLHRCADTLERSEWTTEPFRSLTERIAASSEVTGSPIGISHNTRAYGEQIIKYEPYRLSGRPQRHPTAFQVSAHSEALRSLSGASQGVL